MLDIIIGRDATTQQLRVASTDGKLNKAFGTPKCVPMNVSRKHAQLTIADDGTTCTIRNLNEANITRAAGQPIVAKQIQVGDLVELGESRFVLNWDFIRPLIPKTVDVTPLKEVWEEFKQRDMAISRRVKNDMLLARIPMVFSMAGGLLIGIEPEWRSFSIPLTAVAVLLMLVGILRQLNFDQKKETENNRQWLQDHYKCPGCGYIFPQQDYHVLFTNYSACPHCKAKFKR